MKYFVISSSQDNERYNAFMQSVADHGGGIAVEFFQAVDGSALTLEDPIVKQFLIRAGMYKGQIGCTLSHIALLKWAIENDEEITIFEDDAVLTADWANRPAPPNGYDCVTYHSGNINEEYTPDDLVQGAFFKMDKALILFPTCAIQWSPEGAANFLNFMVKNLPIDQVKEWHEVLSTVKDNIREVAKVRWYWHDIQQMLYQTALGGNLVDGKLIKLSVYVQANPSVLCGQYESSITGGDVFIPLPEPPQPRELTFEQLKRRKLTLLGEAAEGSMSAGYADPDTGLTIATGEADQVLLNGLKASLELEDAPDTELVTVKELNGTLHDITYGDFKPLMARYGKYMRTAWTNLEKTKAAILAATTIEELDAIPL